MRTSGLLLKVYGECERGQWSMLCLDFSLAVQADSLDEAKRKLEEQISDYLRDALVGEDKEFAAELLYRRAPVKYYVKWYWGTLMQRIFGKRVLRRERIYKEPMPLVPAHC